MDKDLRLQVILGAVNKMTAPMKAAQNSNRKLAQAIQSTKKSIRALDEQSGKIAGFRKNKQALTQLSGEIRAAQAHIKALALAIKKGGKDTASLTKEQKKAIEAARKLKINHAELSATLQRERTALQQDGINTHKLASAQGELSRKTRQATQALEAQQKRLKISGEAQARYQQVMSRRNSMLIGGGITMAKGTAGLYALNKPLDESKHYQQEVSQFRALGVGEDTIRDAKQFADSLNVIGNSVTDNMRTLKEAHSVLRHYDEARIVTPELLKMQYATKFIAAGQGEVLRDQSQSVLKIAELRNEINTPEQFRNSVNLTTQAFAASGGMVKPEDYLEAIKTGGESTKNLDDKFFYFGLSHIIQQLGGDRTGTSLASLNAGWVGKQIKERSKDALQDLGLLSNATFSKTGHVKDFTLKNQALYQSNPFAYLQQEILPAIHKKYPHANELQIRNILSSLVSNRKGQDLLLLMYREQANIEKQIKAGGEAYNVDQLVGEGEKTPYGKEIALEAKKHTLYKNIGDKIMPMYVWGLEKLDNALTWLGKFIDNHPQLAKFFLLTATGISLAAVAGGALTVAMAGLLGPLAVARYGFSALTGREMPALGSMLKKLNIRAFGKSIWWLVKSPFAMLRTAGIGLLSIITALGWPVALLIGALVAGAFLVWKYWDRVKAWFSGFLDELKPAWEAIKDLFAPLAPVFEWIGDKIKAAIKWVKDFITPVKSTNEELKAAEESGRKFGKAISDDIITAIDKIKELWGWLVDIKNNVLNIGDNAISWVKEKVGWNSKPDTTSTLPTMPVPGLLPSPYAMPFGGFHDAGGTLAAGRWGIVGERGPEIITGPASITSRSRTAGLANFALSLPALLADSVQAMFPLQSPETLPLHPYAVFAGADSPSGRQHHTQAYDYGAISQPVIHIHAAPTQNAQDIADMVMRAIKKEQRREEIRRRSAYRDRR
ncbi:phage tail tape measure protein [Salmonella enterica]|uniref:phage tail tape measure protein n=1 Tax=Salmonella enterica TaxID=28901 RepID=UPI003D310E71